MSDHELAIIIYLEELEHLREKWYGLFDNTSIYVDKNEIKRILMEELPRDKELFFLYSKYENDIEKVIKLLSDDLRKNGIYRISKYVIPELFKKMLKEYELIKYVKKNSHKLYSIRKRQKLMAELKILYIKQ